MSYGRIKIFFYLLLSIGLIFFLVQNASSKADFHFYGISFIDIPVIVLMLFSFCAGILFWVLFNIFFLQSKESDKKKEKDDK